MSRPLHGVRVIDLTRLLPGAYATQLLVDLGADVIKIEDPRGGDGMRRFGTPFDLVNRGKKSITLDLRSPDGWMRETLTSPDDELALPAFAYANPRCGRATLQNRVR